MTEKIIAIDAAIFAIGHMQNRGSTAYGWKDKKGAMAGDGLESCNKIAI